MNKIVSTDFITDDVQRLVPVDATATTPKNAAVAKLMKAWEAKTTQRTAKGAGLTLMAVSLAACNDDDTVAAPVVETPVVETPVATTPVVVAPVGQTFTLTTGVDTGAAFTGGAGGDTFNAMLAINPALGTASLQTVTALDSIDGGAGNDTLNVQFTGAAVKATTDALLGTVSIKNIETVNIFTNDEFDADFSGFTGINTFSLTQTGTADTQRLVTKDVVSVSVKGGSTVAVVDESIIAADRGASLKTVSVEGNTGLATLNGDGLNTVNLTKTAAGATVVAKAGTRELTANLNEVTGGTVTDATATSVVVSAAGKASSGITLSAAAAKTVTLNSDAAALSSTDASGLTVTALTLTAAAETLTITGTSLTTITTVGGATGLKTITSVGSTAGVKIGDALATGVTFTGGAGKDTISVGATTKTITTGAGDDKVTFTGAVATGGSIDAGAGRDTLSMTSANALIATATNNVTNFTGKVKGFEILEISNTVATNTTFNIANINVSANNAVDTVVFAAGHTVASTTATVSGLLSGGTIQFKAAHAEATNDTVVQISGADTGLSDVLNVSITNTAGINVREVTAANVETVKFLTDDAATTATGIQHTVTLAGNDAKSITVSGDAGIVLTAASTALTSFDASGVTKGAVQFTSGALANAATVKAGQDGSTINLSAAKKAVTFEGGAKADVVTSGLGADIITFGAGNDTLVIGAANQSGVTLATADRITDFGNGTNKVDVQAFVVGGAPVAQATVQAAVNASGATSLDGVLIALDAGGTLDGGKVGAFQYEGNTFVFANVGAGVSAAADVLIRLDGLHTLTADNFVF